MSNLVTFSQANLPSVQSLSTALRSLEKDVAPSGVVIIKMDKTGHWVYGADQTEIEDDSSWAVNPFSFVHGFIAWGDGEVLGEKMVLLASRCLSWTQHHPTPRRVGRCKSACR
jgi:hypothetical protein